MDIDNLQIVVIVVLFIIWCAAYFKYLLELKQETTYAKIMDIMVSGFAGWGVAVFIIFITRLIFN